MSKRIQQVNQLIKKELSQIILREVDFPKDILVTITRVEASVDLNQARVYISAMPGEKAPGILQILKRDIYDLQQNLNKRLRMRKIPRIRFVEEKEIRGAARIEELLEKIHKQN